MQTHSLRARAEAAERVGDLSTAIETWSELLAQEPDARAEVHLAELRVVGTEAAPRSATVPTLPTPPDPFPGLVGSPPEVTPGDVDAAVLGGALQHHGCLLIRGLIDQVRVDEFNDTIERAFAAREAGTGAGADPPAPWFAPCREWTKRAPGKAGIARQWARECATMQVVDSPRTLRLLTDVLVHTGLVATVGAYLGERPVLSVDKTTLRRIPPEARTAWHQDGAFMGAESRAVDIWIALTDCGSGTDAPGMHLMPRRLDEVVEYGTRGAAHPLGVGPDVVREAGGDIAPCTPHFTAGDALVFDQFFLHSTGGEVTGLQRPRLALESWLFAPSTFPADYLPMYV